MLHDVGHILLGLADRSWLSSGPAEAHDRGVPPHVVERERLGVSHAEVGAYVLGTWGVPFSIVEAVAGHHEPARLGSSSLDATTAVHVAEALVSETETPPRISPLDLGHLGRLGLLKEVERWREHVLQLREQAGD
jgi:HD-like signal output (HDOD) protein